MTFESPNIATETFDGKACNIFYPLTETCNFLMDQCLQEIDPTDHTFGKVKLQVYDILKNVDNGRWFTFKEKGKNAEPNREFALRLQGMWMNLRFPFLENFRMHDTYPSVWASLENGNTSFRLGGCAKSEVKEYRKEVCRKCMNYKTDASGKKVTEAMEHEVDVTIFTVEKEHKQYVYDSHRLALTDLQNGACYALK